MGDREQTEAEKLQAAWAPFARRLTQEERRAVAQGDYSPIVRPLKPEWVEGEFLSAGNNLDVKVTSTVRDKHGLYRTYFDVRDFRGSMPRRTPGIYDAPELDELGYPIQPTKDSIEQARREGNYTASLDLAVVGTEDEPSPEFMQRDRLRREVSARDAFKQGVDRRKADLLRYERQLIKAKERLDRTGNGQARVKILETRIRRAQSTVRKAA